MATISLRLDENTSKRLDSLAKRSGRSKTWYIREALSEFMEDMEDMEDIYMAETRLRKPSAGKNQSLDEVIESYGLKGEI